MKVLLVHGGYAEEVAGGLSMAELLAEELRSRGEQVVLRVGPGGGERLPWTPDVVHAFDLARHESARVGCELARRAGAAFALTPATAPELWDDRAAGAELCRAADVLYALTAAEAEQLAAAGADRGRILVVGQGPRLEGSPDAAGFLARHDLEPPFVLFLGRKLRSKGYRELLEAAPAVWSQLPGTRFGFAGPAAGEDWARDFAEHSDPRLVDLGLLGETDKHSALAACDLVCLPTRVDVFPLALVEAWHCGKPVVCGRFDGVEEVVRDGFDGLVVDTRAEDVAAALVRVLGDPPLRLALGERGRERARRELSWKAVGDRVTAGYRRAAAKLEARA
jgi:glycosyltransferase involved in cell wall biosynthesis